MTAICTHQLRNDLREAHPDEKIPRHRPQGSREWLGLQILGPRTPSVRQNISRVEFYRSISILGFSQLEPSPIPGGGSLLNTVSVIGGPQFLNLCIASNHVRSLDCNPPATAAESNRPVRVTFVLKPSVATQGCSTSINGRVSPQAHRCRTYPTAGDAGRSRKVPILFTLLYFGQKNADGTSVSLEDDPAGSLGNLPVQMRR